MVVSISECPYQLAMATIFPPTLHEGRGQSSLKILDFMGIPNRIRIGPKIWAYKLVEIELRDRGGHLGVVAVAAVMKSYIIILNGTGMSRR